MKNTALDKLFKKYFNEVKLYVFSLSRNIALSEEIATDAFYKAFVSIDENKDGFKYWLFKVARNLYIDYIRKAKRLKPLDDIEIEDDGITTIDNLIKEEEYKALYRAIALLKDTYREVILLYYFDGLHGEEIAGIINESVENVKVKLYRARLKLKKILEESHEF